MIDGANHLIRNTIEPRPLPGKYTYWPRIGLPHTMSTMMAPPPGAPWSRPRDRHFYMCDNSHLPIAAQRPQATKSTIASGKPLDR
jgi:hypothetical protein